MSYLTEHGNPITTVVDLWDFAEKKHGLDGMWIGISNSVIQIRVHGVIRETLKPESVNHVENQKIY